MKIVRRLLIVLLVLLVVVVMAATLAFTPAVQRWLVLRAAGGRPGLQLAVERLAVRPGSVTLHHLDLNWPQGRLTLADATAELSLWDLVVHRRVTLGRTSVVGLKVDLASAAGRDPAAMAGGAAPLATAAAVAGAPVIFPAFDGVFKHLRLPVPVTLAQCHVEAEVAYPQRAGMAAGHARVTLDGGHFAPGQEAKFDFDAVLDNPDPAAPVATVEARGTLTVALDARGEFLRFNTRTEAAARGPKLATPARLQAYVALERTAAGETYAALLDSLDGPAPRHLLNLNVDYVAGSAQLAGTWQVAAGDRDLAPFTLGLALPEFSAVGEGRFEFHPGTQAARLAGRLSGSCSRLEVVDARLREFDGLSVATNFDVDYDGNRVRVVDLLAKVSGRKPLLTLQSIQPFALELSTHQLLAADPQKELLRAEVEGLPVSWLRPFLPAGLAIEGGELTGAFGAAVRDQSLWLHTLTPLGVERLAVTSGGRVLLPASDLTLQADVEHSRHATRVQLQRLSLRTATGDALDAQGELETKTGGVAGRASVEGRLPALLAAYAPVGPVQARGSTEFSVAGNTVHIDQLALSVLTMEGRTMVSLTTAEAFSFDTASRQLTTASGRPGEVLRLQLDQVPLAFLQPWLGGLDVGGDVADGGLSLSTRAGRLSLATVSPWRLEGVALGGGGRRWLQGLTVELQPSAEYSADGLKASLAGIRVRNAAGASLFTGHAEFNAGPALTQPKLDGTAAFELALADLAGQPLLAGGTPPGQGKLSGETKFSLDHDLLGEGRFTLNGLISPTTGEPLPVANLSFRAGVSEKGDIALQAPLLVDRAGERSDLTLAATLHPAPGGRTLDAKITGAHVVVDDLAALARAVGLPGAPGPAAVAVAPPVPLVPAAPAGIGPAWAGLTGQVTLDLKSLVYGRSAEITGLTGRVMLDPRRAVVDQVAGKVGADGQLKLNAEVRYAADQPQPYTSKVDFTLQGFEVGPLFKVIAPDRPPTVEGKFDIRSQAEGAGASLGELLDRTRGDVTLQSRKGTFRGLQQAANVARAAGIIGSAARLLGNLGEKVENLASRADLTAELGGVLAQLPYDQLNVRLSRDATLNVKLSDFSLVSPNVRLQGDGQVTYQAGKSLLDQPLQMRVNMGVMGQMESLLTKAKSSLLSGERDDLGYMKLKEPFVIGGTLGKPDPSQLYTMLGRSLLDILLR